MFIIPIQEQDEIVNVISGVVTHLTGKNKSRPLFLTHCRYVDKSFIEMLLE